jgi:DNA-binding NtrC family response regulator
MSSNPKETKAAGDGQRALRALVVDDEDLVRRVLVGVLRDGGWSVEEADTLAAAREALGLGRFDLIFLDKVFKKAAAGERCADGMDFLEELTEGGTPGKVVMITGQGCLNDALGALTRGAYGYLPKPFTGDDVEAFAVRVASEVSCPSLEDCVAIPTEVQEEGLVGKSHSMAKVVEAIFRFAPTDASVLITGPTGSGKEVVAREFHRLSRRASGPFIAINCGAISEGLIESELFGHVRGAFTDARADRTGLLEEADGGTIFLDEITETTPSFQVKLLRALQERKIRRVGSNQYIPIDVRVIAATNKDISGEVEGGRFRTDLFYRLNRCMVHLQPLCKRKDDIRPLAIHFIARVAQRAGRPISCSEALLGALERYPWPGNVRELENAVEGAAEICRGGVIRLGDLPETVFTAIGELNEEASQVVIGRADVVQPLHVLQRNAIRNALEMAGGNQSEAARMLGIDRNRLRRMLRSGVGEDPAEDEVEEREVAVAGR